MRGGFLHNDVLIRQLETVFQERGALTHREHPTDRGRTAGYIDLFVEYREFTIAIEAELTTRRIGADLDKAGRVRATELWIVAPNVEVAADIRLALQHHDLNGLTVFVLTLGQALARVRGCFPLILGAKCPRTTNQ